MTSFFAYVAVVHAMSNFVSDLLQWLKYLLAEFATQAIWQCLGNLSLDKLTNKRYVATGKIDHSVIFVRP